MGVKFICDACGNKVCSESKRNVNYGYAIDRLSSPTNTYDVICNDCRQRFRKAINEIVNKIHDEISKERKEKENEILSRLR